MITQKAKTKFLRTIPGQSIRPSDEPPGWKRRVTLEEMLENDPNKPTTPPAIKSRRPKPGSRQPPHKKPNRKSNIK